MIKFYTNGKYMGYKKFISLCDDWLEIKSWVLSGNDIKIGDKLYNNLDRLYLKLKEMEGEENGLHFKRIFFADAGRV